MKQWLKCSLLCLTTGFFLTLGALAAVGLFRDLKNASLPLSVDFPQGFEFIDHQRVRNQPRFTIKGTIRNSTQTEWRNVQMVAKIYAGDAYMTWCKDDFDYMAPESERPFQLLCKDTSGSGIPGNVTYELLVAKASIEK